MGISDGIYVGIKEGEFEGDTVGNMVGSTDGACVGRIVGEKEGLVEGITDGRKVGIPEFKTMCIYIPHKWEKLLSGKKIIYLTLDIVKEPQTVSRRVVPL